MSSEKLRQDHAPDWPLLLDQLNLEARLPWTQIARVMGLTMLTESMLRSYRNGVQPMFWRGDAIVTLWCRTFGKDRAEVPMVPVRRGHRVQRRTVDESPKWVSLPTWPPSPQASPQASVKPIKRKRVAA